MLRNFVILLLLVITLICETTDPTATNPESIYQENVSKFGNLVFAAPQNPTLGPEAVAEIPHTDNIYDGDTIKDVRFLICDSCESQSTPLPIVQEADKLYFIFDIRVSWIDTPEIKKPIGETEDSRTLEKARAIKSRDFLRGLFDGATKITLENQEKGKYYRIVADVFVHKNGERYNVREMMLESGHAVIYNGKTKNFDWGRAAVTCTDIAKIHTDKTDTRVHITENGKKYHRDECRHLDGKRTVTVTEGGAKLSGFTKCKLFE